jgi:hypothetical protein
LVLFVPNVFGISLLLVWREMTSEEAQICDTHSLSFHFTVYKNKKYIPNCSKVSYEFLTFITNLLKPSADRSLLFDRYKKILILDQQPGFQY